MVLATVVGRSKEDLEQFGTSVAGYIGKHIVGTGEDAHLTTKVFFDFLRPHIVLITGKRGTGKSYLAGVLVEEMLSLPSEERKKLAAVFVDTMGIYWSMKFANDKESALVRQWQLEPKGFENVKVFVPFSQMESYQQANIPVDGGFSILPYEFSAEEWLLAFNLKSTEPVGVALQKAVNALQQAGQKFSIEDIITKVKDDTEISQEIKSSLENLLTVANQWGVFGTAGIDIDKIINPGEATVIDLSHLRATEAWSVRNFIVAILARKIYQRRLIARKEEEVAKMTGEAAKLTFPHVWLIVDEAHNFIPADHETVSSEPLRTIAKQGREPGVSLVVITQMPNKIHQDILSQVDIVFSHRLTSRDDLQALHAVMQTYVEKDLWKYIDELPRGWPGACIVLDDNLEKIFSIQTRPRLSHHAGGTAALV
jgi:DNA helicase HerA-like ATPase